MLLRNFKNIVLLLNPLIKIRIPVLLYQVSHFYNYNSNY